MNRRLRTTEHHLNLGRGGVLRLRDASGLVLHVWSGEVWITQEGDPRDIVLREGDQFTLDRPGLALVQVLDQADLFVFGSGSGAAETVSHPRSSRASIPSPALRMSPWEVSHPVEATA